MTSDIIQLRTKQRYNSFQKIFARLEEVISIQVDDDMVEIINDSIVQRFEFTLELTWNLLKDILTDLGYYANCRTINYVIYRSISYFIPRSINYDIPRLMNYVIPRLTGDLKPKCDR